MGWQPAAAVPDNVFALHHVELCFVIYLKHAQAALLTKLNPTGNPLTDPSGLFTTHRS